MKSDAVLLRIESSTSQDYMELEIVMKLHLHLASIANEFLSHPGGRQHIHGL